MKKITHVFIVLFLIASAGLAQVPMHYNTNVNGGGNSIPFAAILATWQKAQWFIPANSLALPTPVGPGNNITTVYFQMSNTTSKLYTNLDVKLKQGAGTGFTAPTGGAFETGMTTVYVGNNVTLNSTAGGWTQIVLQTPFLYNPALPLIIEIDQNSPLAGGPTVCQAVNIPGPGNGRQWGSYNAPLNSGVGTQQVNFGIDVLPATPCTVTPAANTVVTPTAPICPNTSANLSLANTYSFGGITYQWYSSTLSVVGPFTTAVPNGTMAFLSTPTLTQNTWFTVVATCTNVAGSTTATAGQVNVSGIITNTPPYFEGFEGIGSPNKLPNCSWAASNMPATCQTYTSVNANNRLPRTGTSFASFYYNPGGINYFYTNGIYLTAGITYSAGLWYQTEGQGYNNWTDLSILYNTSQTAVGATTIVSTNGAAISPIYKSLSNTFSVPTSGLYYIAIRGTGNTSSSAQYLSWDDLFITIPCNANSPNLPNLSLSTNNATVCQGAQVILNANGADTYTWSTGDNTSSITFSPGFTGVSSYTVTGTNTLTGCSLSAQQNLLVNPTPVITTYAFPTNVCPGKPATIYASGASSYIWTNSSIAPSITVTPTSSSNTYSVIGTNAFGCSSQGVQALTVLPAPLIVVSSDNPNVACAEDLVTLSATGAASYQWISSANMQLYSGNSVSLFLNTTSVFTVTGTGTNGCTTTTVITQSIAECVGVEKHSSTLSGIKVYPNPSNGEFTVELNSNDLKTIEVSDLTGRLVKSYTGKDEQVNINIKTLANGVYYLKILSENTVEVIKVVKD